MTGLHLSALADLLDRLDLMPTPALDILIGQTLAEVSASGSNFMARTLVHVSGKIVASPRLLRD